MLEGLMLKLKLQSFGHRMRRTDSFEKTLMLGKIEGGRRRGTTEDEMVGWHHRLDGHEFEKTPGVGDGQGSLACCSPWGRKESDTTDQLNDNKILLLYLCFKWFRFQSWSKLHFSTQTPSAGVPPPTDPRQGFSPEGPRGPIQTSWARSHLRQRWSSVG